MRWNLHGHDTGGPDLYANFSAGGGTIGDAPGTFRNHDDREFVHRLMYTAGWHLLVHRLWCWQDDDCQSYQVHAAVFRGDGAGIVGDYIRASDITLVTGANKAA